MRSTWGMLFSKSPPLGSTDSSALPVHHLRGGGQDGLKSGRYDL